ncbi:MAG: hypothetical protein HDR26_01530 [Lachnospiraceae bacterium]|nr:hypothetical protein [Lachnospiraceae bacterium]
MPEEYTDIILATGFSDQGKILKGLPFLDGDDEKNSVMSFRQLKSFSGWYVKKSDLLLIKPYSKVTSIAAKCRESLREGVSLLSNKINMFDQPLEGYGLVIYDNWCNELRKENNKSLVEIECLFPHIFIHYENKLCIKQFLELCMHLVDDMDNRPVITSISKYEEMIDMCAKSMQNLLTQTPENADEAKAKRQTLIGILQRSKELEAEALEALAPVLSETIN